jgi:BMFP domain-containing protein YqiC
MSWLDRVRGHAAWAADESSRRKVLALAGERRNDHSPPASIERAREEDMTQTSNRFFDEMARLMNDAAGVAQGVRREAETVFRTQAERVLRDLDVVRREEFEAVKDMARLAREENEALKKRIAALEARLEAVPGGPNQGPPGGSPVG